MSDVYIYFLLFSPLFSEGCLHQNNIFVFRVHLLPLLLFQLKSQYSVCDITVGCRDNGEFALQVENVQQQQQQQPLCQEQRACFAVHIASHGEGREGKICKKTKCRFSECAACGVGTGTGDFTCHRISFEISQQRLTTDYVFVEKNLLF